MAPLVLYEHEICGFHWAALHVYHNHLQAQKWACEGDSSEKEILQKHLSNWSNQEFLCGCRRHPVIEREHKKTNKKEEDTLLIFLNLANN